jgi:divalent metal cation (Fe/Co/Zn/Cd) transporter
VGSFAVGSALLYLYGFIFKKTAGRLYIPQGSRFMQTAHRIIFGAVFGSVDLGKERRSIRSETKSSLQGWNYLIKNDILCVYFIILAFFGALYLIPVLLLPYGMFLLFMGFYAAAFLVFGSKGLWGAKNKT